MRFRLKALSLHLLASGIALTLILGGMYLGWYHWPGWYLADVTQVVIVLTGVDLVVGPVLTGVIADPKKPRRALLRDIAMIAAVQIAALGYGTVSLWNGRPLYYAFSEDELQLVQAYDIEPDQRDQAIRAHAEFAPHWYDRPRWIWAPLPANPAERANIIASAISGGADVIAMPRYYRAWGLGLPSLKEHLKKLDDQKYFSGAEKKVLHERMQASGIAGDRPNTLAFSGRGHPLLAVFDPATLHLLGLFRAH